MNCFTHVTGTVARFFAAPVCNEPTRNVCPILEKQSWTCVDVKYHQRTITAVLDIGSDITVAGSSLAKKLKWEIYHYPVTSVKTANGKDMLIDGISYVSLNAGTQGIESAVLISPDMTGLILSID